VQPDTTRTIVGRLSVVLGIESLKDHGAGINRDRSQVQVKSAQGSEKLDGRPEGQLIATYLAGPVAQRASLLARLSAWSVW
jgi:hypothetical protein